MNILDFHKNLINNYKIYIQSFQNIKDPRIAALVESEIGDRKLWPEPLVQFNPSFESSKPITDLCDEGVLDPEFKNIFSGWKNLYRHQEEAIRLGTSGREFIVTSGTGSGKSLTYMATIFNHVLNQGESARDKILAVVVYPMNALINSQYKEIEKFKKIYEQNYQKPFPITFDQYTGQESEEQREKLRKNPPHILLTNYVMLELMMTRSGRDSEIRENFLKNIKYLVFDELHTYRGRQGSDVSMLIRRIKAAAKNKVICMGTSATMVSGDATTLQEQRQKVAEVASIIFGTDIQPDQVVNEYLIRSIGGNTSPTREDLKKAIENGISKDASADDFEKHPTPNWIEENIALEWKEGVWVRRKPMEIKKIAELLSEYAGTDLEKTLNHVRQILEWANRLNTAPDKKKNYLPYRIHQFIAQTGLVYGTLGDQQSRKLFLDAGLYADDKNTMLFPIVFSRTSGHEFYCVKLNYKDSTITPRKFYDIIEEEDQEEEVRSEEGYIFIQHAEDEEPVWDAERDTPELPDTWFTSTRKDGIRKLKKERERRLPQKIWFKQTGEFSFEGPPENKGNGWFEGWFISTPLMIDPTSGTIFDAKTAEWTKLMTLGGEGRSTATTVLSFEAITQLNASGEAPEKQKLLSFTDNRQDASLQAGHFNDFIQVGQLRAAVVKALEQYERLDYTNIADKVAECLNIAQELYAKQPSTFPGPKKENEETFRDFIMYRLLHDLRRSWRVVMPNLEQCALLKIEYKYLQESVSDDSLWRENSLLAAMSPDERQEFLYQIFDFFRKSYALKFSMLEAGALSSNARKIKEKLKKPWTLDENELLEGPNHIRLEKLSSLTEIAYTVSAGYSSVFGRYMRSVAKRFGQESLVKDRRAYVEFTAQLLDLLVEGGWLSKKSAKTAEEKETSIYQLKVDNVVWCKGDGKTLTPDLIKTRSYKTTRQKPNAYFQKFYKTNFQDIKPIEGREHTGQISNETRKRREEEFREGKIGALFCSPTMELGIDISDLSVVHMRNVPPSPANYVQRSGRAGRSGQAALVLVYCSNFSAHDRHYFKHAALMVAGSVTPPRIDLMNEELLLSHLNASILSKRPLSVLNNSIGDLVEKSDLERLPLKQEVIESLQFTEKDKEQIQNSYKKVIEDSYFRINLARKKPTWFTDDWIKKHIDNFLLSFDSSLNRWRKLYRAAQMQIKAATSIIENRIYADNHEKKKEAYKILKQAERQRDLLLNASAEANTGSQEQSEFYPYRYLAAEGFLPGYNFTRLPIRSFMETSEESGEFISRARFVALGEFGPQNIIYHDGAKYRVDRLIMTEPELKLQKGKICPKTGYFLYGDQYNYEVDPIINEPLQFDTNKHIHTTLLEMGETRSKQIERITCQEEERIRKGYDIQTYFAIDGGLDNVIEGLVNVSGEDLLHIHYIPTCRLFKLNLKWRVAKESGFTLNLSNGYWLNKKKKEELIEKGNGDSVRDVKLFTSDTANALYIQPIKALALEGGSKGVITLMYAMKRAIENYFQVEPNEIGATIMGEEEAPNILIYEASEGSLGVLSQIVERPDVYAAIMKEAYEICFCKDGKEIEPDASGKYIPATYDDLLNYYNQQHHQQIDKNTIKHALQQLMQAKVEILTNKTFNSYDEHYKFIAAACDPNSSTEISFLKFLHENGLRLPDEAQPKVDNMFVRPDFLYKPNIYVFCDGTPHDDPIIKKEDTEKRAALKNAGYQVLSWYYRDSLEEFVAKRPDIFKKVREK